MIKRHPLDGLSPPMTNPLSERRICFICRYRVADHPWN